MYVALLYLHLSLQLFACFFDRCVFIWYNFLAWNNKEQTKVCDKTDRKLRRFNEAKRDELLLRHVQLSCGGGNERLGGNVLGIRPKKQQKLKHIMTTTLIAAHVHYYSA